MNCMKLLPMTSNTEQDYDYVVIGGGITGIAAARRIQQLNLGTCLIIESEDELGGLCRTKDINGHVLDIGGGHVLHSKYPEVLEWIFDHIPITHFNK